MANDAIFQRLSAARQLELGWRRARRNKGSPGGDGQTLNAFARDLSYRIRELSESLHNGTYHAGPLRCVHIAKKGGGERILAIPCVRDRIVQHATCAVLTPLVEGDMSASSFAYRPSRSVAHAIGRLTTLRLWGYEHVLESDIAACFDSIPHARLLALLDRTLPCPRTRRMLEHWLSGFGRHRGVAQGSPISPLLSNLYLDPLDRAVESRRLKVVRYADDLVVLAQHARSLEHAEQRLSAAVAALDLELKPEKTRRTSFAEGFVFLGHELKRDRVRVLAPKERNDATGN